MQSSTHAPLFTLFVSHRRYCAHHRMFILDLEDDAHPLFANPRIQRRLNADARRLFVGELINGGGGEWLEKGKSRCLVLWRSVAAWAELLYAWAAECGYQGQVVTMDEVVGEEGPRDLRGASEELVMRAVRCLEGGGKAAYIGGEGGDDAGIKFF